MTLRQSKEWFLKRIAQERNEEIGAGSLELAKVEDAKAVEVPVEQPAFLHGTFGRFVLLARRERQLTLEQLATKASVELAELVSIENDPHFAPHARTVVMLSKFFKVPSKGLLQLSGLAKVEEGEPVAEAAVRFAASSKGIDKLTPDERKALSEFVRALSKD